MARGLLTVLGALALLAATAHAGRLVAQPLAQVNVSNARGLQAEVMVAIDPANDQVLLAGSNSAALAEPGSFARAYASTDGGATWTSGPAPAAIMSGRIRRCNFGDPAVTIDRASRQYYAFLTGPCLDELEKLAEDELPPISVQVATRSGPVGAWRTAAVFPTRLPRFDDKPSIAVDVSPTSPHVDRVYLAWSRIKLRRGDLRIEIVLSHSDDGGSTWTKPVVVGDRLDDESTFSSIAVDRAGSVFVAWTDGSRRISLDRSTDGGDHFGADVQADVAAGLPQGDCETVESATSIPAQRRRCITSTPLVNVDDREGIPERVYVTYGAPGADGVTQDVFVTAFDASLRPLLGAPVGARRQVNPPDGAVPADQFMPAAAVDRSTGKLWVCFYDTTGDRRRERVFYSCTASADGGSTWAHPRRAATIASNASVRAAPHFQLGDYAGLAVANGAAHPIWTDTRNLKSAGEEIYTTVLTDALFAAQ